MYEIPATRWEQVMRTVMDAPARAVSHLINPEGINNEEDLYQYMRKLYVNAVGLPEIVINDEDVTRACYAVASACGITIAGKLPIMEKRLRCLRRVLERIRDLIPNSVQAGPTQTQ